MASMAIGAHRLPRPDAILFDLDGTLVDTVELRIEAWARTFAEEGIAADRGHLATLIGVDGRRLVREVGAIAGIAVDDARCEAIDKRSGEIFAGLNHTPRALPGVRELVDAIEREGIAWAIATSSRRAQAKPSVDALGLPHEPTLVDGSHVKHAKPEPDLLLLCAKELGVEPTRCWYVGDATWDIAAAIAAGMIPIGVTAGSAAPREVLKGAGAALVIESLNRLIAEL